MKMLWSWNYISDQEESNSEQTLSDMRDFSRKIKEIIAIDSSGTAGTLAISNYFAPLLEKAGFYVNYQKVFLNNTEQVNLLAYHRDSLPTKDGLILHTHLDTVPPGPSALWTETDGDPYQASIKGDKIFGLGAADVKLDFLCKVMAASSYSERKLRQPLTLVGSFGEEVGLLGIKYLLSSNTKLSGPFVLVGEPTNLALANSHKGYKVFRLKISKIETPAEKFFMGEDMEDFLLEAEFFGKEGHSSTPELGHNAIEKALEFLCTFEEDCSGLLAISGGRQHNIIPGNCRLLFLASPSGRLKELFRSNGISWKDFSGSATNWWYLNQPPWFAGDDRCLKDPGSGAVFLKKKEKDQRITRPNDLLGILITLSKQWQAFKEAVALEKNTLFSPPYATSNLGIIFATREKVNIVVDLRFLPHQNVEAIEEKVKNIGKEIEITHPYYHSEAEVLHENPPYLLPENSNLLKVCCNVLKGVNGEAKIISKPTSTEAGVYARFGFEPLIFGPGPSIGNAHAPNEHNLISHLKRAVTFYEEVIRHFCL